jgi:hypothetical protein
MNAETRRIWGLDWRLALWLGCLVLGFCYVAGVVNGRDNPLISRDGDYLALTRLLVVGGLLYFAGPCHALPDRRNLRDLACFLLPFAMGLQFYYGQRIDGINVSLTPRGLAHAGPAAWALIAGVAALLTGVLVLNLMQARRRGQAGWYAGSFVAFMAGVAGVTWWLRDSHSIHIHHYNAFGVFLPWLRFNHPVTLIALGACTGIFVEGVTTWGMDPVWNLRD